MAGGPIVLLVEGDPALETAKQDPQAPNNIIVTPTIINTSHYQSVTFHDMYAVKKS